MTAQALPVDDPGRTEPQQRTDHQAVNETFEEPPCIEDISFGHNMGLKRDGYLRLVSLNLNNFAINPLDTSYTDFFAAVRKQEVDGLMLQETGINWTLARGMLRWQECIRKEFGLQRTKSKLGFNTNDETGNLKQWGGTAIVSIGSFCQSSRGSGVDPSGLGRWTWTRHQGKDGIVLRLVSLYRPASNTGELSVGAQHTTYLHRKNDYRTPRAAILQDFRKEFDKWKEAGDTIVIGGDLNEDVNHTYMRTFFETTLGLRHTIFSHHSRLEAPATHQRNRNCISVDGMWCTPFLIPERCGYLKFGDYPSDHRGLWADFRYTQALGYAIPPLVQPHMRRLTLQDPRVVKRFIKICRKESTKHKLIERQFRLETNTMDGTALTPAQKEEANTIDNLNRLAITTAESQCRKLRTGGKAFSLDVAQPKKEMDFWKLALKRRKGLPVSSRHYTRAFNSAKLTRPTSSMTVQEMEAALKKARTAYLLACKHDQQSRLDFIKTFPHSVRRRIETSEEQRRKGMSARRVTGKMQGGAVTKVIGTDAHGQPIECITKSTIERACLDCNELKYRQCELQKTPFMTDPLLSIFGHLGETEAVQQVLDGTFHVPAEVDEYTSKFIMAMRMPDAIRHLPRCSRFLSTATHINGWKKAKERTSSGISGLHFGTYKARLEDPLLAAFDASMRSVAYSTGFVYDRWKFGIDVELIKKPNDLRVEKLRTVLLLEADANMNYKNLSRDVMRLAERAKVLSRETYGGRKKHRSIEVSLNQRLTGDILRQLRKSAIIVSNDAKGCFDRIVHLIAYICLLRFGMPGAPIRSMLLAIQQLTHHVRTAFGVSDDTYGNDPNQPPLQGLLQGNGASGTGWNAISTVIIDMMKAQGFGFSAWSAISREVIDLVCFAFVDDTDLIQSGPDNETSGETVFATMQNVLDHWEGALRASGGALGPEKCYWTLIDWIWRNERWCYRTKDDVPGDLHIINRDTGEAEVIERLEPHQARLALGIPVRHDGNMTDVIQRLKDKAIKWADALRSSHIRKSDAWYTLNCTIMKTIAFPLMATTIKRKEFKSIMAPIYKAALRKSGVQWLLPRKLVYGTHRTQALALFHPWITQLIEHLHAILRHGTRPTPTGQWYRTSLEAHILECGSTHSFWSLDRRIWKPILTESWVKSTWEDIDETPLRLTGPEPTLLLQRQGDVTIMDCFVNAGFRDSQLLRLNECRTFLHAVTLADLCDADGILLAPFAWTGCRSDRHSPYDWPRTVRPKHDHWIRWQHALRTCFLFPMTQHMRLRTPLGMWNTTSDDRWKWWYASSDGRLYERHNHIWTTWVETPTPSRKQKFTRYASPSPSIPHDLQRASTYHRRHSPFQLLNNYGDSNAPLPPLPPTSLSDRLSRLPDSISWCVRITSLPDDGLTLAQAIQQGTSISVCDGSLKLQTGTAAYVLEGPDSTNRITGVTTVPGPLKEGDSYRCELTGILAVVLIADTICEHHHIPSGSMEIGCDNSTSLRIFHPDFVPEPYEESFDLVFAIWSRLQRSSITWTPRHVKGHQDDNQRYRRLDRWARLNVEMDCTAKVYWNQVYFSGQHAPQHHAIDGEGWTIWFGDVKMASPKTDLLYGAIHDHITIGYWVRHNRFPQSAIQDIDWDICEANMKALGLSRRRWVTKHASENCGVGVTLVGWNKQDDDKCPRCAAPHEDTTHVLKCHGRDADLVWNDNIAKLQKFLSDHDTAPSLTAALLLRLSQWRNDLPFTNGNLNPSTAAVLHAQDNIGWKNLLEGLAARHWLLAQQRYYLRIGSKCTGKRWILALLKLLNNMAWDQWEHRNAILHRVDQPRHHQAIRLLDDEITNEFILGRDGLQRRDHHHFRHALAPLLNKPLAYKKSWLYNVHHARASAARFRATRTARFFNLAPPDENLLPPIHPQREIIITWMRTGRLR